MIKIENTDKRNVKRLVTPVEMLFMFKNPSLKRVEFEIQACKENNIDYYKCKKRNLGKEKFSGRNDEGGYYAFVTEIELAA